MNNVQQVTETITKDGDLGVERVREVINTDWEKGIKSWKAVTAQGKESQDETQIRMKNAWGRVQGFMQNHPQTTVGIALVAVGALGVFAWRASHRRD